MKNLQRPSPVCWGSSPKNTIFKDWLSNSVWTTVKKLLVNKIGGEHKAPSSTHFRGRCISLYSLPAVQLFCVFVLFGLEGVCGTLEGSSSSRNEERWRGEIYSGQQREEGYCWTHLMTRSLHPSTGSGLFSLQWSFASPTLDHHMVNLDFSVWSSASSNAQ